MIHIFIRQKKLFTNRSFSTATNLKFIGKLNKQLAATRPKEHVVTTLNKPIGFQEPPKVTDNNGDQRSISQKFKDFLNREKNKERQKELEKEISKSGMYDIYTYRKTNGKLFLSPPAYWKAEKSLYFPNFFGETLETSKSISTTPLLKGKVSVIRVYTSQIGEKSSQSFFRFPDHTDYLNPKGYDQFLEKYSNSQIIDINVTENALKALFIQISKSGLRKLNHPSRYNKYFIVPRKTLSLDLREAIHCDNTYGGFIYVLDHEGRIRWVSCGEATDNERNLLWRTVRGLEKEYLALFPNKSD
ncbi:hypothetical protein WICMUC_005015 [Wickerhamomyces mucosus]|uniref:Mitochondrial ATPase complex subunit ATP10 n=1 Tax=Wickerhamomyces mucosus TaxID=1378264 RepID=A0A9P8PCB5_9ASCO|nr:hypothetical protein WICMUC_005015 [Wickerhamomyces mucosus]